MDASLRDVGALSLFFRHPARLVVISFLLAALVGGVILALPFSSHGLSFGDALFTAVSAVCVTGLSVIDISTRLTPFGHVVVLILIQLGGLGIIVFSLSMAMLVRARFSFAETELLSELLGERNRSETRRRLARVLTFTFGVELVGGAALAVGFALRGVPRPVWMGLFHAVSAFCNAGFALFSTSLEPFRGAPIITGVVGLLIVAGGLGVTTLFAVRQGVARAVRRAYVGLMVGGALVIYLIERGGALSHLPIPAAYGASLFQSVTLRTAGFNTIPIAHFGRASLLFMIPLMLIGGASGGTAGGVKVSTALVLWGELRRHVTGRNQAIIARRAIPSATIGQAFIVSATAIGIAAAATIVLVAVEPAPTEMLLFEAVSALATVGLTAGVTPSLGGVGRVTIGLLMLVGRLGPLTLLAAFGRPGGRDRTVTRLAEEPIVVG